MLYIKEDNIKSASQIVVIKDGFQIINPPHEDIIADGWVEYTPPPVDESVILKAETERKVEELVYKANVASMINTFELSNKEAVAVTELFPKWEDYIGKSLSDVGFKVQYNNKLYEILQAVPSVIANQTPDLVPANYGLVSEHSGTKDDPIPYEHWLVIKKDKYYTENGKLYIGLIDAPNGYDADLSQLPTLAKEVIE